MEHSYDHYLAQRLDRLVWFVLLERKYSAPVGVIIPLRLRPGRGECNGPIHGLLCVQDGKRDGPGGVMPANHAQLLFILQISMSEQTIFHCCDRRCVDRLVSSSWPGHLCVSGTSQPR